MAVVSVAILGIFERLLSSSYDILVAASWGVLGAAYTLMIFDLGGVCTIFSVIAGFYAYEKVDFLVSNAD